MLARHFVYCRTGQLLRLYRPAPASLGKHVLPKGSSHKTDKTTTSDGPQALVTNPAFTVDCFWFRRARLIDTTFVPYSRTACSSSILSVMLQCLRFRVEGVKSPARTVGVSARTAFTRRLRPIEKLPKSGTVKKPALRFYSGRSDNSSVGMEGWNMIAGAQSTQMNC